MTRLEVLHAEALRVIEARHDQALLLVEARHQLLQARLDAVCGRREQRRAHLARAAALRRQAQQIDPGAGPGDEGMTR